MHPVKSWICLNVSSSPLLNIILYTWNFFPHEFIEKLTLPSGTKITAYASSGGWKEVQSRANLPVVDICEDKGTFVSKAAGRGNQPGPSHRDVGMQDRAQEVHAVDRFAQASPAPAASPRHSPNKGYALETATKGNLAPNATSGGQPSVEEVCLYACTPPPGTRVL